MASETTITVPVTKTLLIAVTDAVGSYDARIAAYNDDDEIPEDEREDVEAGLRDCLARRAELEELRVAIWYAIERSDTTYRMRPPSLRAEREREAVAALVARGYQGD